MEKQISVEEKAPFVSKDGMIHSSGPVISCKTCFCLFFPEFEHWNINVERIYRYGESEMVIKGFKILCPKCNWIAHEQSQGAQGFLEIWYSKQIKNLLEAEETRTKKR